MPLTRPVVAAALAAAALTLATAPARAQPDAADTVTYRVRKGDTLELVAAEIYGERNDAILLLDANKLQHPRPLVPGEKLRIPRNREHVTQPGDTWASLATALLGDERRAPFLAAFNDVGDGIASPPSDPLTAGTELELPIIVTREALGAETLAQIATDYFGDAKNADLLKRFNFLDHDTLDKGDKLLVPVVHLKARVPRPVTVDEEAQGRRARQRSVREAALAALPRAHDAWAEGDFTRVVDLLGQDTIDLDYLDIAVAVDLGVLLGKAYAGTNQEAKAIQAFQEVVRRKHDHALDAFSESPKVRELWKKAGGKVDDG